MSLNAGKSLGVVDGLSYAVKDNLAAKGIPTTCGSRFLKGNSYINYCIIRILVSHFNLAVWRISFVSPN